jgi:hypothetical protein
VLRSEAQKEYEAREDPYNPKPSSNAVGGAFGNRENEAQTDEELALTQEQKRAREQE